MANISATILTFNEEKRIKACIDSLRGIADEIIVVDSFSTDRTAEICRREGCEVTQRRLGGYGAQRQYATSLTSYPYVLSVDADEVISPALKNSILQVKREGFAHRGYCFARLNFYCGMPIRHCGWYPDLQVRLFDKRYANWNLHDVDERVIFRDGVTPCRLDGDILHYRCDTPEEYEATEAKHAGFLARRIIAEGHHIRAIDPYIEGMKSFAKCFIMQKGMLDGIQGRDISLRRYHSALMAWKAARIKQQQNASQSDSNKR